MESNRNSFDFDVTHDKQVCAMLKQIDDWAIQYICDNSVTNLKKVSSTDVIKENYKPLISHYGDNLRVRTKINTAGHRVCSCWDDDKNHRDLPEEWLNAEYDVQVSIPQLWIMGSSFGLTMEGTNLLVHPIQNECPF